LEDRRERMSIPGLRKEQVPMCVGSRDYVRIASYIGLVPGDGNVAVGVSRDPGEYIRLSGLGRVLSHLDGRRPARPVIVGKRVIDVSVIRPGGVHVPEVVHRERGEQVAETGPRRTRRTRTTTENLVVSERECGIGETDAGGHAHVGSIEIGATVV